MYGLIFVACFKMVMKIMFNSLHLRSYLILFLSLSQILS